MPKKIKHPALLADINAFRALNGLSKAKFGTEHMGDPKFVYDLESGRECRMATVQKVIAAMSPDTAAQ
jgi:hypothetical protein